MGSVHKAGYENNSDLEPYIVDDHDNISVTAPDLGLSQMHGHYHQVVENVDLKRKFPCSKRKAFRLTFRKFVHFCAVVSVAMLCDRYLLVEIESDHIRSNIQVMLVVGMLASFLSWLHAYWMVKFRGKALNYFIKDGSIVISKGIFVKKIGSFSLSHITDVYLVQEQLDWLFKTFTLCISTANQSSGKFAFIEGFDEPVAQAFQEYLLRQAEISSSTNHGGFAEHHGVTEAAHTVR